MNDKAENLIIGGVHKAGTTSLYTYLSWHPDIIGSEIKETHFFSGENYESKYDTYEAYFKNHKGQKYKLEASPEYIYEKETAIKNIKENTNKPKLIFIFRNPTDKILSSFNHRKKHVLFDNPDYTFEEFKNDYLDIRHLDEAVNSDNVFTRELLDGSYISYIKGWFNNFNNQDIKIIFFDDLKNDPEAVLEDLCDWLNIDFNFYKDKSFTVENKSVEFKNKPLQKIVFSIYMKLEPFFRNNYKLKSFLRDVYYKLNVDKKENILNQETLLEIDKLYIKKNAELREFLLEKGYTKFPEWM